MYYADSGVEWVCDLRCEFLFAMLSHTYSLVPADGLVYTKLVEKIGKFGNLGQIGG